MQKAGQLFTTRPYSFLFVPLPFRFLAPVLRKRAVIFLNPPLYASRVASVPTRTGYGLLSQVEREPAHRINVTPERIQIAEHFPGFAIPLGQRCGLLACRAWRLTAVKLVQLPAILTIGACRVCIPLGPRR